MKAKRVTENINFNRGQDPKRSLNIGYESKLDAIKEKKYLDKEDWDNMSDGFLIYFLKPFYDKWAKKNKVPIKSEEVKIWKDRTSGSTPIIKVSAPGIRKTTFIRGETHAEYIWDDLFNCLNTDHIKSILAKEFSMDKSDSWSLGRYLNQYLYLKYGINPGGNYIASYVAERLMKLLEEE